MKIILAQIFLLLSVKSASKVNVKHMLTVDNIKDYKKVLKTNKNVLTLFSKDVKSAIPSIKWMEPVAKDIKGKGTFVVIICGENKESKKLCKKEKVSPTPLAMKHYKDGAFNKDYDRKETAKSMLNFMNDPTGDAPWEEDTSAKNVVHVKDEQELVRLRRKEKGPLLVMFYAPWCGFCKKLKPDFSTAADEVKGKAVLAGMDVDKPDAFNVKYQFNITGFPTLVYFEKGEEKFRYGGEMTKDGIVKWLENPTPKAEEPAAAAEDPWIEEAPEITHLTDDTFADKLAENKNMLVMFYAPWCGHCKKMKPELVDAAKELITENHDSVVAAIDCTVSKAVCQKYDVSGYPTVKYFEAGEFKYAFNERTKDKIVEFMKDPKEPPPPPPADQPWSETSGPDILHLTDANFKDSLKKRKHVLVMFYAPWCGHCKKAKPEFEHSADFFQEDRKVSFAGVDCTTETKTCETFDVKGYPTFRYFLYGKKDKKYEGGRTATDFVAYMKDPHGDGAPVPEPPRESEWKDVPSKINHLTDDTFEEFMSENPSVLVMFYAPWCGHCKAMKPAFAEAAAELAEKNPLAKLAAVDATKERNIGNKYVDTGYPTIKYFKNGQDYMKFEQQRTTQAIVDFMSSDGIQKPTLPPKVDEWSSESPEIDHLTGETFDQHLKQHKNLLVMFYAPWCGHCKKMKPEYAEAAKRVNTANEIEGTRLCAVDCDNKDLNEGVCSKYGVRGFPTIKYFSDGEEKMKYKFPRKTDSIIKFLQSPSEPPPPPKPTPWSDENKDVDHLTADTFDDHLKEHKTVFVMFYAPWCGHCKSMKPDFAVAAKFVNTENQVPGRLAAIDCTEHRPICKRVVVSGYPTLKLFKQRWVSQKNLAVDGVEVVEYEDSRSSESLIAFMRSHTSDAETKEDSETRQALREDL